MIKMKRMTGDKILIMTGLMMCVFIQKLYVNINYIPGSGYCYLRNEKGLQRVIGLFAYMDKMLQELRATELKCLLLVDAFSLR